MMCLLPKNSIILLEIMLKKLRSLSLFILLVFFIEWTGYKLTITSVNDWYLLLQKPSWNPPGWLFGPVWTILYIMIAVSGWLVLIKAKPSQQKQHAFIVYTLQLVCNLAWSYFFFFLKNPGFALVDVVGLLVLIGINIKMFTHLYRPAAILLIPYFIWTLFATILNGFIWTLNR